MHKKIKNFTHWKKGRCDYIKFFKHKIKKFIIYLSEIQLILTIIYNETILITLEMKIKWHYTNAKKNLFETNITFCLRKILQKQNYYLSKWNLIDFNDQSP